MKSHKTKVTIFEQMQLLDSQENKDNLKTNEKKKKTSVLDTSSKHHYNIINISKND